jgi:hypothetical protein
MPKPPSEGADVPDRPASPLDVLLPLVTDLSARQQELAQHSNVKRYLLGVYNATNRSRDIVAKYEDPVPLPEAQLPPPPPKP